MSMDVCISERRRPNEGRQQFVVLMGLFAGLSAMALAASKPMQNVTDVRFWTAGDTTRVAIEVSGEFSYKADRISGPDRVFFDLETTKLALKDEKTTIPVGDGLVKQVRMAERKPGTIRVVLDLEDGVDYTVSRLSNPERLMVELSSKAPKPAPKPVAKTAKPEPTSQKAPAKAPAPAPQATAPMVPDPGVVALIPPVFASIAGNTVAANVAPPSRTVAVVPAPSPAPSAIDVEPTPAERNSNGERSLTRVLGLKLGRVVIDPGHGGHDQGTHGKSGMLEKDLVLDVSNRLAAMLRERLGTEVVLTRTDDSFIALEERTRLANEAKADLFLSVHANSSPMKSVAGVETFYLNFTTGKDDLELATRENAASERSIADLKEVVSKIAMRAKVDESREFALRIQDSLHSTAVKQNKEAKDRGVKRAPFVVLIGADMPSVLAEIGFLSNTRDETLLKGEDHRDRIAEALYKGIEGYAESLSKTTQVTRAQR